jgi:uncharacterized iron-regulated protein
MRPVLLVSLALAGAPAQTAPGDPHGGDPHGGTPHGGSPHGVGRPVGPTVAPTAADTRTRVIEARELTDMDRLLDAIADRRVVFVGESHDRYEDHLNQLQVIEGLKRRGKDLAIGMEFFQQPYQAHLDAFVAGQIDESQMLRRTQYFDRWRYDYRLYRPILRFARDNRIPVIALNLEQELTQRVGDVGIAGLNAQERARIPSDIDRGNQAYRERVKAVFDVHPMGEKASFDRFLEVQLLWDEGMAERAARYLKEHPEKTLVVLAGAGHVEYGQGIPGRLLRRLRVPSATLLNATERSLDPTAADYLLFPQRLDLPTAGLLGVMLKQEGDGKGAVVEGLADGSGAKQAGIKEGDRIVRVGDSPVTGYTDVRIALMDRRPGERVPVVVQRKRVLGGGETATLEVELH